jgi:hypothetical protein
MRRWRPVTEEVPVPWGMKKFRVPPDGVREGDWVLLDGAWRRVRDMRRPDHGRVLIFKDRPPKTVTAALDVAREVAHTLSGWSAKTTRRATPTG